MVTLWRAPLHGRCRTCRPRSWFGLAPCAASVLCPQSLLAAVPRILLGIFASSIHWPDLWHLTIKQSSWLSIAYLCLYMFQSSILRVALMPWAGKIFQMAEGHVKIGMCLPYMVGKISSCNFRDTLTKGKSFGKKLKNLLHSSAELSSVSSPIYAWIALKRLD